MNDRKEQITSQSRKFYKDQLITLEDLISFKDELLHDIKKLLKEFGGQPVKKWLKSREVKKLLNISPGTLQTLRTNGTLPYTKIGGVIYYDYEDITQMLTPDGAARSSFESNGAYSLRNKRH